MALTTIILGTSSGATTVQSCYVSHPQLTLLGYGLTGSVAMYMVMTQKNYSFGPMGSPVPVIEVKLKDHPAVGYLTSNMPPHGEVLICGNSVTKGYDKRDNLNKDPEIFTEDGWFKTVGGQWFLC